MPADANASVNRCPHCQAALREKDMFCPACGAYLDRGLPPLIFASARLRVDRGKLFFLAGILICVALPAIATAFLFCGSYLPGGFTAWMSTQRLFLIFIMLAVVLFICGNLAFRMNVPCPACSVCIHRTAFIPRLAFCCICGTRILPGAGPRCRQDIPPAWKPGDCCGYCAEPITSADRYCRHCGVHVAGTPAPAHFPPYRQGSFVNGLVCSLCGEHEVGRTRSHIQPHYCDVCGVALDVREGAAGKNSLPFKPPSRSSAN